jgi:5,5'-dehydrodivanillate O-demethylase oxygenase subunit
VITKAMNERLTRVGPGTPCGDLMRRYWIPIAPFAQLLENPVRRVRVLGEDLILYRDRSNTLGLIGDRCLHRRVDLQFGIPDECGLRCPYHGWLYDETGTCTERPLEAQPKRDAGRKLAGYPVRELGGLVFAYLGPLPAPALPRWDLYVWPNALRQIAVNVLDCNWLQCQENTADPTHSVWTHGHFFAYQLERGGELERAQAASHTMQGRMKLGAGIKEVYAEAIPYGMKKGVVYSKELGAPEDSRRESHWVIFPFCTRTGEPGSPRSEFQLRIPIDDTHTYHICYQVYAAPPEVAVPPQEVVPWYEPPLVDEQGRRILDYVLGQDMTVWTAQGEVCDRSEEVLGRTDAALVFLRRQLDEQIRLVEEGKTPLNVFAESPEIIPTGEVKSAPKNAAEEIRAQSLRYRGMYHKGYGTDDADRYGPAFEQVKELHRRIEAAGTAREEVPASR